MDMSMKCDIILPVCDQFEFTKDCIGSIRKYTDTPYRLIIINNGTNPDTKRLLDGLERDGSVETTIVHNDHNIGWVKALNKGMELSTAPFVCFQNDDTLVTAGWLRKMITTLDMHPQFGLINPSWEGRPAGVTVDRYNEVLERKGAGRFIETDWCRGFSVVVKRSVMERIGDVDERYGLAYFDDVDYSVTAIEAGFLCLKALDTYVYHHKNVTFFEILKGPKWNELHEKNKKVYYKKWGKPLKIAVMPDPASLRDAFLAQEMIDLVYELARKQHRVHVWSSNAAFAGKIVHTNVVVHHLQRSFLGAGRFFDLMLNAAKKVSKRYDAVFVQNAKHAARLRARFAGKLDIYDDDGKNFKECVTEKTRQLKENTKGSINVEM